MGLLVFREFAPWAAQDYGNGKPDTGYFYPDITGEPIPTIRFKAYRQRIDVFVSAGFGYSNIRSREEDFRKTERHWITDSTGCSPNGKKEPL